MKGEFDPYMDGDSRGSLIIILILLGLAAYFAITETALSSVSRNRIKLDLEHGDTRAKRALYALDNFDKAITTLLICTNIVHISIASIVTVFVTKVWGLSAVSISTIITTLIVFFLGEMLPKSFAKKNSESCILTCAGPLLIFMKVLSPLAAVLSGIGNLAGKLTKSEPEITVTEDELYDIIEDLEESGVIDEDQSDLLSSALQFEEVTAKDICTPRVDVVGVNLKDDPKDIFDIITDSTHSRLPVYDESKDNIIGVLSIRRYIKRYLKTKKYPMVRRLLDEPFFAPQDIPIDELLEKMSQRKVSLAIIKDEFGGTYGIVTIEDILEELVGEIYDEDDQAPSEKGGEES
ncbi:MAG: hemolysin family protein [Clostridia bacterium]|nr:hemolysin family protein [Clostridia bacterium]